MNWWKNCLIFTNVCVFQMEIELELEILSVSLVCMTSVTNPIIYAVVNPQFRTEFYSLRSKFKSICMTWNMKEKSLFVGLTMYIFACLIRFDLSFWRKFKYNFSLKWFSNKRMVVVMVVKAMVPIDLPIVPIIMCFYWFCIMYVTTLIHLPL